MRSRPCGEKTVLLVVALEYGEILFPLDCERLGTVEDDEVTLPGCSHVRVRHGR
jgi:hypothetical protein